MSSAEASPESDRQQSIPPSVLASNPDSNNTRPTIIEFKKDGTISRMRSHRGNMPSLPQTKVCPLCPARFTRTTHLNRHMRTHSNERLHRCDTCSAEFTRSDLLTRHKKGCGDPNTTQRTRRKSCQACAESKVKCDLQYPCTKCKNRGKECIYVGDYLSNNFPGLSLGEAAAFISSPPSPETRLGATAQAKTPAAPMRSMSDSVVPSNIALTPAATTALVDAFLADPMAQPPVPLSLHRSRSDSVSALTNTSGFSSPGSPAVPNLAYSTDSSASSSPSETDPSTDFNLLFSSELDALALQGDADNICGSNLFQPFFIYLFFTAFLKQMPIIHGPTWEMEGKPAVLLDAMYACGALYVKTRKAANFVTKVLDASRETLLQEFTRELNDTTDQIHLILAVSLLQTIGLFHQKASQRATSSIYHGMLVMMIRRCGLISKVNSWAPPAMVDAASTDRAWREWGLHETAKRALLLSYLHDCCHALYFAIRPSFNFSEVAINLPCEDALWLASSSKEWSFTLLGPSPYGQSMDKRLIGVSMPQVQAAMREYNRVPGTLPPLSPFAHFVVVHTILRDIYAIGLENSTQGGRDAPGSELSSEMEQSVSQEIFNLQYSLHNWLQSWMTAPETPKMDDPEEEPPFTVNVLPYYWLAQVSILAYQEGLPPFKAGAGRLNSELQFRLVKHWLEHIRSFLRKGERAPTLFWDELMKVRLQTKHVDCDGGRGVAEHPDGLLGFFTEN
ncbi:hypothetical protein GLOTRDRAFT_39318 [Gloeophyllum trabeum ATCC 11539]|uniref:Zn(2)-C6 fungal-type domain-containing protein n=1 Tax=Gloeophyllum trabeum (strain ATCC 11539 / FP-39264 / Madison 617) TaxID=670483 RepID=S7RSH4_GLOTA|nr:uncharacterized protein GLOTRDRAFT_39318 [Gloeophyllum trabeum ATCC 11539]EPQ57605.1 hypothetical protein GLOTRDRAFT_39318 [Gloeophyllum trabeum ATCC 11539]